MTSDTPAPTQEAHVEALAEGVSKALYVHNSPVIELSDDEYDCCARVAIDAVLASDWLAAFVAERQAEALREAADAATKFRAAISAPGDGPNSTYWANPVAKWLRERADRIGGASC